LAKRNMNLPQHFDKRCKRKRGQITQPRRGDRRIACRQQFFCAASPTSLPAYPTQPLALSAGSKQISALGPEIMHGTEISYAIRAKKLNEHIHFSRLLTNILEGNQKNNKYKCLFSYT